jgi:xanthine dehydrogenase accessory factor
MRQLLEQIQHLRALGGEAAMATLIATRGLGSRRPGTKMWVGPNGRVLGAVTLGGCVETRVVDAASAVLDGGAARVVRIDLTDEEAWDLGLTCAGSLEVYVEAVRLDRASDPVLAAYEQAASLVEQTGRAAIAWRLDGDGGRMVLSAGGVAHGSLGDAALDDGVASRGNDLLMRATSGLLPVDDAAATPVFVEVLTRPRTLIVFGAGPIAEPLLRFARELELRTVVIAPNATANGAGLVTHADEVRSERADHAAAALRYDADTAVVLIAHDYKIDLPVLRHVLQQDAGYVGVLGSRRRGGALLDFLRAEGIPPDCLARVRVPVGLDIGAESPAEVALSVLAEILAVRGGRAGGALSG